MIELPPPSQEQNDVINSLLIDESNIMLNSVAGSGKTTTALHVAQACADKAVLLITYNKRLKLETRVKALMYDIRNLKSHSYHALGVFFYNDTCCRDTGILRVIEENIPLRPKSLPNFDIIIIDEAQDITGLLYKFMCKFLGDQFNISGKAPLFLIIGDALQSIYAFKGADARYLTKADKLFPFNAQIWRTYHYQPVIEYQEIWHNS